MDVGPRRDLVGDLAKSIKRVKSPHTNTSLHFGLYHSLFEWFNPGYLQDKANNFTTSYFVDTKTMPELYDLVRKYHPELIWSDGEWEAPSSYWKSTEFLAWYATHSAVANTAVWNDRWGADALCKHGGYLTCSDRYQPGKLVTRKWENALTIDGTSWGFNHNSTIESYLTTAHLIHELIETVAYNGNMLLNVGPGADGTMSPIFLDRLQGIGEWLGVNGDAIYSSRPWNVCQNETNVYYTTKGDTLYAIATRWPAQSKLFLNVPKPSQRTKVHMLGVTKELDWTALNEMGGLYIEVPALTPDVIPCQHAWVFSLTNIVNFQSPASESMVWL
jgi:alpha-L-fucosidase